MKPNTKNSMQTTKFETLYSVVMMALLAASFLFCIFAVGGPTDGPALPDSALVSSEAAATNSAKYTLTITYKDSDGNILPSSKTFEVYSNGQMLIEADDYADIATAESSQAYTVTYTLKDLDGKPIRPSLVERLQPGDE